MGARSSGESNSYIAKGGMRQLQNKREIYIIADVLFYYALQPTLSQRSVLLPQLFSSISKKTSDGTIYTARRSTMAELFRVDEVINALTPKVIIKFT